MCNEAFIQSQIWLCFNGIVSDALRGLPAAVLTRCLSLKEAGVVALLDQQPAHQDVAGRSGEGRAEQSTSVRWCINRARSNLVQVTRELRC